MAMNMSRAGCDEEVAPELRREAAVQAGEEKAGGVVAVLLRDDGGLAALAASRRAGREFGDIAVEFLREISSRSSGADAPLDHLFGGDAHRHVREVHHEDDDGALTYRNVGDLLAGELIVRWAPRWLEMAPGHDATGWRRRKCVEHYASRHLLRREHVLGSDTSTRRRAIMTRRQSPISRGHLQPPHPEQVAHVPYVNGTVRRLGWTSRT